MDVVCLSCGGTFRCKRSKPKRFCRRECYDAFRQKNLRQLQEKLVCTTCRKEKFKDDFYLRSNGRRDSECKACIIKRSRRYAKANKGKVIAKSRRYYKRNRVRLLQQSKSRNHEFRVLVLTHYSGGSLRCACCQETTIEFLAIDHVDGDGNKHRRSIGTASGGMFYRWLVAQKFPRGFQVLCHNCNIAKGCYGVCPHQQTAGLKDYLLRKGGTERH